MPKKIGFDATAITKDHNGGKDQVALNLLSGFEMNGLGNKIVVFCKPDMTEYITSLIPSALIVPVLFSKIWKKTLADYFCRTFELPIYIRKFNIGVLLFPIPNTGLRRYKIPTAIIPHDIQTQSHKERFSFKSRLRMAVYYHFDFWLRDWIIAISNFDKEEIESEYPKFKNKILMIYNPILTDLFTSIDTSQSIAVEDVKPYITAVNIQHLHKNTITLIKAFEEIMEEIPHNLYLIGKVNAQTSSLLSYVDKKKLGNRIKFLGFLDATELASVLKGSALYVNPSLFEGFGMTSIEAMLSGVSTLVSAVSAVPEVTMNLCHYYKPADDERALSKAMKQILTSDERDTTEKLKAISDQVRDRYDYIKISNEYFELLASMMQD